MLRKIKAIATSILVVSASFLPASFVVYCSEDTIVLSAPDCVDEGEVFVATVEIFDVVDFDAGQFDVHYDPNVIRLDDALDGVIDGVDIPIVGFNEFEPGHFRVVVNVPWIPGVSGSGYLSELHFAVVGVEGDYCNISFSDGYINDNRADEIEVLHWIGDSVSVSVAEVVSVSVIGPGWNLNRGHAVQPDSLYYSTPDGSMPTNTINEDCCSHRVINEGNVAVDVMISFGDMAGEGEAWFNSESGMNGDMEFSIVAQRDGGLWSNAMVIEKQPKLFVENLPAGEFGFFTNIELSQ